MGYTYYSYLILIGKNSDATVAGLKEKLSTFYARPVIKSKVEVTCTGNTITVNRDGYEFCLHYSKEPHVRAESEEMAKALKDHPKAAMIAKCEARFEMSGDPDPNMDYFNDSLYLQEMVDEFKEVYIRDSFTGEFMNLD